MGVLDGLKKDTLNVLVVDDFATMRRMVKNCLEQLGFSNISLAEDGRQALDKMRTAEKKFDLVVSDWNMPNMMGIELLKEVRADGDLKNTPFLMVTAEGQKENVLEAVKAGVSNYIVKPFTIDVLEEKLEVVFKKELSK